jgi:death-on-curing protein
MTDYLTLADVLAMHTVLIDRYGGASGVRDMGALEAALYRPQSGYYEDIIAEAAALMESLAINHPFVDGNKRVAFAAVDVFLRINGYRLLADGGAIYIVMLTLFEEGRFVFKELDAWLRKIVQPASIRPSQ